MNDGLSKLGVTLEIFFEVSNSKLFGGEGSVGYSSWKITGNGALLSAKYEELVSHVKADYAKLFKVPEECLKVISREEFDLNTEEEDEEEWED